MYLSLLREDEKNLFLELAYEVSNIDGDFGEAEKIMIDSYCEEMKIVNNIDFDYKSHAEEIEKNIIENCGMRTKKIIIFEIVGLAMSDGKYDVEEKEYISKLAEKFMIDNDYIYKCENVIDEYMSFQNRINMLVIG